jgi:hypothetical protein
MNDCFCHRFCGCDKGSTPVVSYELGQAIYSDCCAILHGAVDNTKKIAGIGAALMARKQNICQCASQLVTVCLLRSHQVLPQVSAASPPR